jgi:exonuclease SbcC
LPPEGALAKLSTRIEAMSGAQLRAVEAAQAVRDTERCAVMLETTRQHLQIGRLRLEEIERALADQAVSLAGVDARLTQARRVLAQSLAASAEAAEALRAGLVEGEPCPVCGAAEHPLSALESLLGRHLEENRAQTAALEQEWTGLRGDQQAMLREKEALTQQQAALAGEESDQLSAVAGLNSDSEDAKASLQQAIDVLGIEAGPDLGERLSALRQTANQQRDAMQAAQADVDRTRRAEDAARQALEEARRGEQAARDRLRMRNDGVNETRNALAASAAALSREGEALDLALAAMVDWRSLSDGAAWVRGEARSWRDHAAEQAEAAQALPALAQALSEAGSARDVAAAQARSATEAWRQRNEEAEGLRWQRAALLEERAVQDVDREIAQAADIARKASETARDRREQAARMLAGEKAAMAEAEGQLAKARATLDQADSDLTEALDRSGVTAADLARVASLGAEGLEAEAHALTRIEGAVREAQAVMEKCNEDLARHAASPAMDEGLQGDALIAALAEVRRELDSTIRALEEARLAIRQDDLVRERTAALRARLEAESAKAHVWLQLSQLIGDSEGKNSAALRRG